MQSKDEIVKWIYDKIDELVIDMTGNTKIIITNFINHSTSSVDIGGCNLDTETFAENIFYYININNYDSNLQITPLYYNGHDNSFGVFTEPAFQTIWNLIDNEPIVDNYANIKETVMAFNLLNKKVNTLRRLIEKI